MSRISFLVSYSYLQACSRLQLFEWLPERLLEKVSLKCVHLYDSNAQDVHENKSHSLACI